MRKKAGWRATPDNGGNAVEKGKTMVYPVIGIAAPHKDILPWLRRLP
jgi:hypothetical protein